MPGPRSSYPPDKSLFWGLPLSLSYVGCQEAPAVTGWEVWCSAWDGELGSGHCSPGNVGCWEDLTWCLRLVTDTSEQHGAEHYGRMVLWKPHQNPQRYLICTRLIVGKM